MQLQRGPEKQQARLGTNGVGTSESYELWWRKVATYSLLVMQMKNILFCLEEEVSHYCSVPEK